MTGKVFPDVFNVIITAAARVSVLNLLIGGDYRENYRCGAVTDKIAWLGQGRT